MKYIYLLPFLLLSSLALQAKKTKVKKESDMQQQQTSSSGSDVGHKILEEFSQIVHHFSGIVENPNNTHNLSNNIGKIVANMMNIVVEGTKKNRINPNDCKDLMRFFERLNIKLTTKMKRLYRKKA